MKNKILNRFIGVIDNRDEYQLQEIHKELAFSGMLLWTLTMIVMFISLIIDTIQDTISFSTIALFVVNMIYAVKIMINLRKNQLVTTDCYSVDEYESKKKQLKKQSTIGGIMWGTTMFFLMQYVMPYLSNGKISVGIHSIIIWSIGGILFGLLTYFISKNQLKKLY